MIASKLSVFVRHKNTKIRGHSIVNQYNMCYTFVEKVADVILG